ncbi:hypothetical protein B0H21DRAFT_668206, partial [Amylocystis lapponica]
SKARDVWTFYEDSPGPKRTCLLCKYVQASKKDHVVKHYGLGTGTGPLRRHLYERHADDWISRCDQLHIPITAKEAQPAVADYRRRQGQNNTSTSHSGQPVLRRPFSNEAFVDAIIEFIVADDQV